MDPANDGWVTEVLAQAAESQLGKMAAMIGGSTLPSTATCQPVVSASFSCPALRPAALEDTYRSGGLVVRRATKLTEGQAKGASGLAASLAGMIDGLGASSKRRARFEVVQIEEQAGAVVTSVVGEAVGYDASKSVQQNMEWNCRWEKSSGNDLRLLSIRVDRYEEVTREGAGGFSDCTESVIGSNASYGAQLSRHFRHWFSRIQTILGVDVMVHNGVAVADVNGDGLEDVYLCQPGGLPNKLFVQQPDGTALDQSTEMGLDFLDSSRAALFVDLDNDGDQDLAVLLTSRLYVFENEGAGKFKRKTDLEASAPYSLSAVDYNGDGRLDLHVCGYSNEPPYPFHNAVGKSQDFLFRNDGDWSFKDETVSSGLEGYSFRFTQAGVWEDYDNDGDIDFYVANDYGRNNLYRNDGGKFTNVAKELGAEDVGFGKAVACADFNRDGWLDFYTSAVHSAAGRRITSKNRFLKGGKEEYRVLYPDTARGNELLINDEGQRFVASGLDSGAALAGWSFDSRPLDFNNDGQVDLVVANGFTTNSGKRELQSYFWRHFAGRTPMSGLDKEWYSGYAKSWATITSLLAEGDSFHGGERNRCFLNLGKAKFVDVSGAMGFDLLADSRAMGVVDWDRDGDLDVWISGRSAPTLRFVRNENASGGHHVSLRLQGTSCNRDAIGARVDLLTAGGEVVKYVQTVQAGGGGYLSQSSKWLHFGIGDSDIISRVVVKWPGGEGEQFSGIKVDGRYLLVQGQGRAQLVEVGAVASAIKPSVPDVPADALSERAVLSMRSPLPDLPYSDVEGTSQVFNPTQVRRTFLTFWSLGDATGVEALKAIGSQWKRFEDAGLNVLALNVDALMGDGAKATPAAIKALGLPFSLGVADLLALQKMETIVGGSYHTQESFALPMSFLIDQSGYLTVVYRGPVSVDQILGDLKLTELDAKAYVDGTFLLPGHWNQLPLFPSTGRGSAAWFAASFGFAEFPAEDIVRFWKSYLNYFDKVPRPQDVKEADLWNGGLANILVGVAQRDLFRQDRGKEAIASINAGMKLKPEWTQLYLNLGDYLRTQGADPAAAIETYLGALPYEDGYAKLAVKRGAWTLCCSEVESVRDKERAMKLAQDLHDASNASDPSTFDLLAACHAAFGNFDKAIELATQGHRKAAARNAGTLAKKIKGRLELYRQKKAYFGLGGIK